MNNLNDIFFHRSPMKGSLMTKYWRMCSGILPSTMLLRLQKPEKLMLSGQLQS